MSELGDLLERMHGARRSFERFRGEFRLWYQHARQQEAFQAATEKDQGTSYAVLESGAPTPPESEARLLLWLDGRQRARAEHHGPPWGSRLVIQAGDQWWSFDEQTGALTNEGDPTSQLDAGGAVSPCLDPAPVIGLLDFEPLAPTEVAGRAALLVRARPRPRLDPDHALDLHALGRGADEYELAVDNERGVLLRLQARRRGQGFQVIEAVEVEFDGDLDEALFHFELPPGEELRSTDDAFPRSDRGLSLHEVAEQAPFKVLVPASVLKEWRGVEVIFTHGSDRPPSPASLSLWYRSADMTTGVTIGESAAEGGERLPTHDGPRWREVPEQIGTIKVRDRDCDWPQAQLEVEIEGTLVTMSSDSLSGDQLVELARRLVPVGPPPRL